MSEPDTKVCARCFEFKPFDQFDRHAVNSDGRQSYCQMCRRIYQRVYKLRAHRTCRTCGRRRAVGRFPINDYGLRLRRCEDCATSTPRNPLAGRSVS